MANVDEDLLRAAEEGNYDEMLTALENGASVHYVGDMGWYPPPPSIFPSFSSSSSSSL